MDIDPRLCTDAQTLYQFKVLLLQKPDQTYERVNILTALPTDGWVYTVCKLCADGPKNICKCQMWLRNHNRPEAIPPLMERDTLSMDEMIVPEQISNMVLGSPSYKDAEADGALNLRQFSYG